MKATIHFYIRYNRPAKDGSVPICLLFLLDRKHRTLITTGKSVPLKAQYKTLSRQALLTVSVEERKPFYCWNSNTERLTPAHHKTNLYLDKEKARAIQIIEKFEAMNRPISIDQFLKAYTKPKGNLGFKEYFMEEIVAERKDLVSKETLKNYSTTITKICRYKPNLTLADINYRFLSQFENYMVKSKKDGGLGNCQNTVAKTMRIMRTFLQVAIKNGDFHKDNYPFADYKIFQPDPVLTTRDYLEPEEIFKLEALLSPQKIYQLHPGEIRALKRFLGACYTGLQISTNITDYQTLCDFSNPSLTGFTSNLNCLASTCTVATTPMPCANAAVGTGAVAYASGSTLITTTGSAPCVCIGDCGSQRLNKSDSLAQLDSALTDIVHGIGGNAPLPTLDSETRWASQYYVSGERSNLNAAQGYGNAKLMAVADAALNSANYAVAQNLNFFSPNNVIESNWQKVNGILIKKLSDKTYIYSTNDIATLESVAQQCPLTGGKIVYKARAILNGYYQTSLYYATSCNLSSGSKLENMNSSADGSQIIIYPNPSSGIINVEYKIRHTSTLEITDISGKLVGTYALPFDSYKVQIKDDKLQTGLYLYRIVSDGFVIKTGKVAIMK